MATFGNTVAGGNAGGNNANTGDLAKVTLSQHGLVTKISVGIKWASVACNAKGLLYSDSGGEPLTLLGVTPAVALSSTYTWTDFTFTTPLNLAAGDYWIGVVTDNQYLIQATDSVSGQARWDPIGYSYTTPATTWDVAGDFANTDNKSIYGTYSPITTSSVTKSLKYSAKPHPSITKSLKRTVKAAATPKTKSLKYAVKTGSAGRVIDSFENYQADQLITDSLTYSFASFPNAGTSGATNPSSKWEMDTGWVYAKKDSLGNMWGYTGQPTNWGDRFFFRLNTRDASIADQIVSFKYKSMASGAAGSFTLDSADAVDTWIRYQTQYWLYVVQFDRTNDGFVVKRKVPSNDNGTWGGASNQISNKGVYYQLKTDAAQPIFGAGLQFISWNGVQSLLGSESAKPNFPNLAHDGSNTGGTTYNFEVRVKTIPASPFNTVQLQLFRAGVLVGSFTDDNTGTSANGRTFQQDWDAGYYNGVTGFTQAWGKPIYSAGKSGFRSDNIQAWFDDFSLTSGGAPLGGNKETDLRYFIRRMFTPTKSLKYTVRAAHSAITKSLKYTIVTTKNGFKQGRFNGTTSFATIPVTPGTSKFSLGFWFTQFNSVLNARIVDWQAGGPVGGLTIVQDGINGLTVALRNAGTATAFFTTNPVSLNVSHSLDITYDSAANGGLGQLIIYLDGVEVGRDDDCLISDPAVTLTLGRRSPSSSNFSQVDFDEFYMYTSRVLTSGEITTRYNSGSGTYGGPDTNLVVGYHFDQLIGTTIQDYSGNFNKLTTTNVTLVDGVIKGPTNKSLRYAIRATPQVTPSLNIFGYYKSSKQASFAPSEVPWYLVTHLQYAFVNPNTDGSIITPSAPDTTAIVTEAHNNGKKIAFTVGGAGLFVSPTSTPALRATFIANLISYLNTYGFDGIDIDWEPPPTSNSAQFTAFITELRAALPVGKYLSIATEGDSASLVASVQSSFDFINIMTYDRGDVNTWHTSGNTGHMNPLFGGTKSADISKLSHVAAGIPLNKLAISVGFYGYKTTGQNLLGAPFSGGVQSSYRYASLSGGQLAASTWDSVAQSTWLGDSEPSFRTYDSIDSVKAKVNYARTRGLQGVQIWELEQDWTNGGSPEHPLAQAMADEIATPAPIRTQPLQYIIHSTSPVTKSLKYCIITKTSKTKSLKYSVRPAAIAITKSLKYTVKTIATAITKSLKYNISTLPVIRQLTLLYKIKAQVLKTKSLKYTVRTTPTAITIASSYSEVNSDATEAISTAPFNYLDVAQSIAPLSTGVIDRVQFYVRRNGTPTGNVFVKILGISGTYGSNSIPSGGGLATSDPVDISTISTSMGLVTFNFSGGSRITLNSTTKYAVLLEYVGGDASNWLGVGVDTTSPTHPGNASAKDQLNVWTASPTHDYIHYVYLGGPGYLKNLAYDIRKQGSITKSLKYTAKSPQSKTKSLKYTIRITPLGLGKVLKYTVRASHAAITKSLKYVTLISLTSQTKSLRYAIIKKPLLPVRSILLDGFATSSHTHTQAECDAVVAAIVSAIPNINYIDFGTYLDYGTGEANNQIGKLFTAIHNAGRKVIFRQYGFNDWQGTFGVTQYTASDFAQNHQTKVLTWIDNNYALFQAGDKFESVPDEPENNSQWAAWYGSIGTATGKKAFNDFISETMNLAKARFASHGVTNIDVGILSTNPSVSRDTLSPYTWSRMTYPNVDSYPEGTETDPATMAALMNAQTAAYIDVTDGKGPKVLTFGPNTHIQLTEQQQADAITLEVVEIKSVLGNTFTGLEFWNFGAANNPNSRLFHWTGSAWSPRLGATALNVAYGTTDSTLKAGLQYEINRVPGAKTKSLKYTIDISHPVTKSLRYGIRRSASALTKTLAYRTRLTPIALTRSLTYSVRPLHSTTKTLKYDIRKGSSVTKSLRYGIAKPSSITKSVTYVVTHAGIVVTRGLLYKVKKPSSTTKSLIYEVAGVFGSTKQLVYKVKAPASVTKSLRYDFAVTRQYSRETLVSLPTGTATLGTIYSGGEMTNVDTVDGVYVGQASVDPVGAYMVHLFKPLPNANNTDNIAARWNGKSSLAPSHSPVYLQLWNYNANMWDTIDSEASVGANVDFELYSEVSGILGEYYSPQSSVTGRVYQQHIA